MYGKKLLLTAVGSLVMTSFVHSAHAYMSMPDGWYLEGNVGSSHLSNKSYPGSSSSSGVGGNANVGYKFMPFVSAEVGYTQYANTSVKDQFGTKAAQDKHYSYDLAAKGILPIAASGFEVFAKLGVQRTSSKVTIQNQTAANNIGIAATRHSNTGLYIGAGGEYAFMP